MGPRERYEQRVAQGTLRADAAQLPTIELLDALYEQLIDYKPKSKWLLSGVFGVAPKRPKGLYIYGGVGRGKSMMMDLFFDCVPIKRKRRVHFHAFMQEIHTALHAARKTGIEDAIRPVAEAVIKEASLLCFDEMQITDITDAMLVGRLFEFLIDAGVIVVTTSNRHPSDLYKDGLNRDLFLPFIALMETHLLIHNLDSQTDHRLGRLGNTQSYFHPLSSQASVAIETLWQALTNGAAKPLTLAHKSRKIVIPAFYNGVGKGTFSDFCSLPLGPGDYLKIAETCRVLFLLDIPQLSPANNNEAKRFVTLIDALYEARVKLIASAASAPNALYRAGKGAFEFERTASRLYEMQAEDWGK